MRAAADEDDAAPGFRPAGGEQSAGACEHARRSRLDEGALLEAQGCRDVGVDHDYGKIERVVSGVRPTSA